MTSLANGSFRTPQNTPANNAPINSRAQAPGLGSLKEEDVDRVAAASLLAKNPAIVSMLQNRLGSLVGQSSGYVEGLPSLVRRRIAGLKSLQKEHVKLEAQFQEEVLQLEKKYLVKYSPLYQKRAEIVNGKAEPSEQQVTDGVQEEDAEEGKPAITIDKNEDEDDTPMTGVPEFWLTAVKNSPNLADMISDEDEGAMKHLVDIRMEYLDRPGFRLIFEFADQNEYFSNKTLTKTYYYQEESGYSGDFIYDHADGDKINWKPGKDLTVRIEQKKQRNKNTKQTRIVKKTVPTDSFFNFFSPPQPPKDESIEVADDIEERLELDYSIGEEIKDKLIPRAVDWFTGEALQHEGFEEQMDEGEFEDEDDLDDEDLSDDRDEDDESDEDIDGPRSAKQDTAECKQS